MNEIKENVLRLLKENKSNEIIFDWIDDNVCGNGDPVFIRALVTAVHEYVITGSGENCKLAKLQLKTRTELLKHYIKNSEKCELQALYAIQALTNQLGQPCDLLPQIFDVLYDNNVITGKTFKVWESSTDPNESEGKDVAVLSVKSFFIRLRRKEELEKEKLIQSVQVVLNQLTTQTFNTGLIDTEEKLNVVTDFIFEKAINEPYFSFRCANLCKLLALIKVPVADHGRQQVSFHKLLLTKCQKEFEEGRSEELIHYEEKMEATEETQPETQRNMKFKFNVKRIRHKKRQLGNIRFIGELYNIGMLIEPVIHDCIKKLLSRGDEDSLLCLCKLLKTIGRELGDSKDSESSYDQSPIDLYFAQMQMSEDKELTSSRVQFMLQDVILKKEKEKLKRSVQGVLNKLTPQKFKTLLAQLKGLTIDTEEKLNVVTDLIFENVVYGPDFENVVRGPDFSVRYAKLCKYLAFIKVPVADQSGGQVNFHKLLITKCQNEFEQDHIDELKHEERMKAIEEAEPDKQEEMKHEFELKEKKLRYRQLGNIRFIGALFKLGMLLEPIMHKCIKKLLSQGDEESLECLCKLLKTIGEELDDSRGSKSSRDQSLMDLYFAQMQKYVDKQLLTSPRVRFMLQDVIDLKKEKEKLKRSVQGVLNKLTPQKFKTLLAQLKGLTIDTEEKLNVVTDLIFKNAVHGPDLRIPYANLCKHLALIKVPVADQGGGQVNFRKLLLTKCQKEFEQDRSDELKHEERMKAIEEAESDKQKEMKHEFELKEKKMRSRQLGNIRFIGELFKLGMLIEPIMHECIKELLSQGNEESLECLCILLKTIGKELDVERRCRELEGRKSSRYQSPMDLYFAEMQTYIDNRLTSSRVRFMLQDVIDLKKCSWVPRKDENMPKTIDQIHQEAEREVREQQINLQNMSSSNYPKRMPDDCDRRKTSGRNNMSDDGWTPTSSKSNKGSYSALDPTKLKLTKPDEVETIRLGPGGRGPSSWGRGYSGGSKTAAEEVKTATTKRYSALESLTSASYDGRRGSQRSAASSRESSRGRSNQLSTAARKTSTSKEREDLLETVKVFNKPVEAKAQDTKKNDVHVNGKAADPNELILRGPEYNEEDMEKKTKPLIDEFLHNNDFEEAIKCVTELASPNTVYLFINTAVNQVLERSSQARYSLGQLLFTLLKKKIISFEQYKKGVGSVFEIIDDYALDIPLIWDYMGEILEPMIEDAEFPLTFLKEVLQPCIPSEKAGLLVSAILHCSAKRKGTIKLGEFWKESGLQWTDFLEPGADVNEFIRKHKLEFTVSPTKVKPNVQMTIEEIKKNLISLLKENEANESAFDWIDANVSGNSEPAFIRALVTAVLKHVITGSGANCELSNQQLKNRTALLTRYIKHNEKLELQALYAIQALMNQLGLPSGLLRQIFDILYDDDVITEETFKVWESSTDPNESEGKGVAVHSVKSFFTWLRESESGEEPEE